jgi:hypothetical protein
MSSRLIIITALIAASAGRKHPDRQPPKIKTGQEALKMKIVALSSTIALASLLTNPLVAQAQVPAHGSAAEARHDAAGDDPAQQQAQRKLEDAESTTVVTETKLSVWDSEAGKQFVTAIQSRKGRWADFDEIVFKSNVAYSEYMLALMAQSPYAADIAYYLGTHPNESALYASMPPEQSGPAIRAIEEKAKSIGVKAVIEPVRP